MPAVEKISREKLLHAHLFILQEMARRGMKHNPRDSLDKDTLTFARDKLKLKNAELRRLRLLKSSGCADSWMPLVDGDHVLVPNFISLVGSALRRAEADDLDFCIRGFARDEGLEILLAREMGKAVADKLHFIYNPAGPHGTSLPLFDLVLRRKKQVSVQAVESELVEQEKADISPLTRFQPMKPRSGRNRGEFFDPAVMFEQWAKPVLGGGILIEPKINGFRFVLQKASDGGVLMYFEGEKKNLTKILPSVAKDVKKIRGSFIVDAELQEIDPKTKHPVSRLELQRFTGDSPQDDSNVVIRPFDILHLDGRSLADLSLSERKKALRKWVGRAGKRFKIVRAIPVRNKGTFTSAVRSVSKDVGSEGAMAKVLASTYTLAGATSSWAKLRTLRRLVVKVLKKNPTPLPGIANYTVGVGPMEKEEAAKFANVVKVGDRIYIRLGNTFNTKVKVSQGDNLEIQVAEVIVDQRGEKTKLGWVLPFVESKSADRPVTTKEFMDLALPSERLTKSVAVLEMSEAVFKKLVATEKQALSTNQKRFNKNVKEGAKGQFILHMHERGSEKPPFSRHLDVRMSVGGIDNLEGLLLTSSKFPTRGEFSGSDLKKLFDDGTQMLLPDFKPPQPKQWLRVARNKPVEVKPGEVGATRFEPGRFVAFDFGAWVAGPQDVHHKVFFFKGTKGVLNGRFVLNGIPKDKTRMGRRSVDDRGRPRGGVPTDRVFVFKPEEEKLAKICEESCSSCEICSTVDNGQEVSVRLLPVEKADIEKRIVFGVVLEPKEVDSQGDTIRKPVEIEVAAHNWLAKFQDRGVQHKQIANSKIEIYESYIVPVSLTIGGQRVKKGSWLLMYHIVDDALWKEVKAGKFTGFSIGGFARRRKV